MREVEVICSKKDVLTKEAIDALWEDNKAAAVSFFDEYLRPSKYKEETKEECMEREETFFKKVCRFHY